MTFNVFANWPWYDMVFLFVVSVGLIFIVNYRVNTQFTIPSEWMPVFIISIFVYVISRILTTSKMGEDVKIDQVLSGIRDIGLYLLIGFVYSLIEAYKNFYIISNQYKKNWSNEVASIKKFILNRFPCHDESIKWFLQNYENDAVFGKSVNDLKEKIRYGIANMDNHFQQLVRIEFNTTTFDINIVLNYALLKILMIEWIFLWPFYLFIFIFRNVINSVINMFSTFTKKIGDKIVKKLFGNSFEV